MTSDIEIVITTLVHQSNKLFSSKQFVEAAVKAEKAYSLAIHYEKCPNVSRRRLEFNLACIYAASNNFELAKGWLDRLDGDSSIFTRRKELAVLYSQIASAWRHESDKQKPAIKCLKLAGEYYARCQMWHEFCLVNLARAQMLIDSNCVEQSIHVANKILAATFYLDHDKVALAKIYNDLSTIFAIDPFGFENIRYSKKLLKAALRMVQEHDRVDLETYIYQNLAAVSNQLENFDSALKNIELAFTLLGSETSQYHIVSDLKFNEGYATFQTNRLNDAIDAFSKSHHFALKTNQNNVWESLECLACVYNHLEDYDMAVENIRKALSRYNIYCQQKQSPIDEKITSRLEAKLKTIKGNKLALENSVQPLKDPEKMPDIEVEKKINQKSDLKHEEEQFEKERNESKTSFNDSKSDQKDDELSEVKSDPSEGDETLDEGRDSVKKMITYFRQQQNQLEIEEEPDSESIAIFKDQIIDLKKPKDDDEKIKEQEKESNQPSSDHFDDDGLLTAIQTNDSGEVVVTKVKKSELEEYTLVLNPRNSLDPESSLHRDIEEYRRVMERQEQLFNPSRRNSAEIEAANQIRDKIEADQEPIPEEDEDKNSENNLKIKPKDVNEQAQRPMLAKKPRQGIRICSIS